MIELDNRAELSIEETFVQNIADTLTKKDIELIITTNSEIQQLNKQYRQIDKATDVLSFPYEDMPMAPLGTIIISKDFVIEKAKEFGHTQNDEFSLLFIHGLLHLLGFDHEIDDGQMREKEEELIKKFYLPSSLIVRTEG